MSAGKVAEFYNEVVKDNILRDKFKDVNEKTLTKEFFESEILPEAKAKGYDFTYEDVKEYYKKQGEKTELDMDDMESVSGGCGKEVMDLATTVKEKIKQGTAKRVYPGDAPDLCRAYQPKYQGAGSTIRCGDCNNMKNIPGESFYYCEASCAVY